MDTVAGATRGAAMAVSVDLGGSWRTLDLRRPPAAVAGVLLYRVLIDAVPDDVFRLLSGDERARVACLRFDRDRRRFAAARGTLRRILSAHIGTPAGDLRFDYGPAGKPSVRGGPTFNLSHSGPVAVVAVGGADPVGVDVERIVAAPDLLPLLDATAPDPYVAFYRQWCRREAVAKATGVGLAAPVEDERAVVNGIYLGNGFGDYAAAVARIGHVGSAG